MEEEVAGMTYQGWQNNIRKAIQTTTWHIIGIFIWDLDLLLWLAALMYFIGVRISVLVWVLVWKLSNWYDNLIARLFYNYKVSIQVLLHFSQK